MNRTATIEVVIKADTNNVDLADMKVFDIVEAIKAMDFVVSVRVPEIE